MRSQTHARAHTQKGVCTEINDILKQWEFIRHQKVMTASLRSHLWYHYRKRTLWYSVAIATSVVGVVQPPGYFYDCCRSWRGVFNFIVLYTKTQLLLVLLLLGPSPVSLPINISSPSGRPFPSHFPMLIVRRIGIGSVHVICIVQVQLRGALRLESSQTNCKTSFLTTADVGFIN